MTTNELNGGREFSVVSEKVATKPTNWLKEIDDIFHTNSKTRHHATALNWPADFANNLCMSDFSIPAYVCCRRRRQKRRCSRRSRCSRGRDLMRRRR